MAPATEIVFIPLSEENYPDDFSSAPGKKFKDILATILAQDGVQRLSWGRQVENPGTLTMFIDWDSVDHHKKFMSTDAYGPFMQEVGSMVSGDLGMYHVHFDPHPPTKALVDTSAHVTEFITAYFPKGYSAEDQKTFTDSMNKFVDVVGSTAEGFKAAIGGFVEEELTDPKSSEPCLGYVALIGWTSVEAHLKYRETQAFKDNIHYLRGAKDLQNVAVFHVPAKEVQKGSL
ncbi:hypothetical protein LTS15_003981 [Exophiala xenobiotica]|nr:hypothetical protein LTS15_003981 [Exophiala xenobiotica]